MGLETIVRPVVFPNIRPTSARVLPPEHDPEKGLAKIRGNPTQSVTVSYSFSFNWTSNRQVEIERRVDKVRVYQKDDDGEINRDNFVDIEVANRIRKRGAKGPAPDHNPDGDTSERGSSSSHQKYEVVYQRLEEANNIEIQEADIIKKNPDLDTA